MHFFILVSSYVLIIVYLSTNIIYYSKTLI
nr:MAG TPA: hypothetical protein [Caudoviricetes sp.]